MTTQMKQTRDGMQNVNKALQRLFFGYKTQPLVAKTSNWSYLGFALATNKNKKA